MGSEEKRLPRTVLSSWGQVVLSLCFTVPVLLICIASFDKECPLSVWGERMPIKKKELLSVPGYQGDRKQPRSSGTWKHLLMVQGTDLGCPQRQPATPAQGRGKVEGLE